MVKLFGIDIAKEVNAAIKGAGGVRDGVLIRSFPGVREISEGSLIILTETDLTGIRAVADANLLTPLDPSGVSGTADGFVPSVDNNTHLLVSSNLGLAPAGQTRVAVTYLRLGTLPGETEAIFRFAGPGFSAQADLTLDLATGIITDQGSALTKVAISDAGNGWFRVHIETESSGGDMFMEVASDGAFSGDAVNPVFFFWDIWFGLPNTNLSSGTQPRTSSHAFQGFVETREKRRSDQVATSSMAVVTILGASVASSVIPQVNDSVTIDGDTYTLVELLSRDPAEAVYEFRTEN
ncbi:MAG: hypothetical protein V3S55_15510 [Nitrospiraceae bacterium]